MAQSMTASSPTSDAECPICGGEGLGWGCDGCGRDGGPCKLCREHGAPGGCFGCGRDLRARHAAPAAAAGADAVAVQDEMILEETVV